MTRDDWRRAAAVSFESARQAIAKSSLALCLIYVAHALYYFVTPDAPAASTLSIYTGLSAVLLGSFSLWAWDRDLSARAGYVWAAGVSLVILININAALVATGDYLYGISHMFVQLAAGILAPTPRLFAAFTVVNIASLIATTELAGMSVPWNLGVLGFIMTTTVAIAIFITRLRNLSRMEVLRRAIEENRDRDFREIIEKNPDAVILVRDGVIAYASSQLATYLQLDSAADVVGERLDSIVVDGSEQLEALLRGDHREPSCVVTLARRDGENILVDVAEPKLITFDDAPAVLLVARDVTASQAALNARLLLADRMLAIGTLAAGVAHEVNNPLTYVNMNLDEIVKIVSGLDLPVDTRAQLGERLSETRDGVERVAGIIKDLSAVSSIGDAEEQPTDPLVALRVATNLVEMQLRSNTELVCDLRPLPKVVVNEGKLTHLFFNVLVNALQAIDARRSSNNKLEIIARRKGSDAIVEVFDTGCGMSAQDRKRIFDPFFTTRPPGRGTGLGMFFCHSLVDAIGGRIEIESQLGVGTCVRLILPGSRRTTGRLEIPPTEHLIAEVKQLSVLVVDDEPFVAKAIGRILSRYDVTVTSCGEEAIAEFALGYHDLVLCDIMMPGLSGQQVYERLLELDPTVSERVIFMTGGAFTPKAREFARSLGDRVLRKPVSVEVLLELAGRVARAKEEPTRS